MPTFRAEIQEAIDAITLPTVGESVLDRTERIIVELVDVGGKLVTSFDEENRDEDLRDLKEELETATIVIVNRALAGRPLILRGAKMALPTIVEMGVDYVADNSGTVVDFAQARIAPFFSRLRRIGERGEVAFSVAM